MSGHLKAELPPKDPALNNEAEKNNNDNGLASMAGNLSKDGSLSQLLYSEKWIEHFHGLSRALGIEFEIYSGDGEILRCINENPYCRLLKSSNTEAVRCPESCRKLLFDSIDEKEIVIHKCQAGITHFILPIYHFDERAFIVGRAGFASYEDLLEFLALIRENNLGRVIASDPLNFCRKDTVEAVSQYVRFSVDRQLKSIEENYKTEEKILRLMSLFDSRAFTTLSKRQELLYRYILDSIEFVFGKTSAVLLTKDEGASLYRAACSTGRHEDALAGISINADNRLILEMSDLRSYIRVEDIASAVSAGEPGEIKSSHFFPVFSGDSIELIIGICDRELSRDDTRILNALTDFIQLNLENRKLRLSANSNERAVERLSSVADFSRSIAQVLDDDELFRVLLDKSLKLLNAEQGSLMLLDDETSELIVEARKSGDEVVKEKMRLKKGEGIAGKVIETGESLLIEDIESDPRVTQQNRSRYKTKSFISVLIKVDGRITGVLNAADKIESDKFSNDDLELIQSFLANAAIAIERSILFRQTEELRKLSITDPLTGIYNRRYLNSRLEEEITRYNRYKHPFSFLMYDLDGFKAYNDTFGHLSGDKLLRNLAGIIGHSLRNIDIAARFGGDEFVSIFPQTPKVDAIQITNRLKEKIDEYLVGQQLELPITISMGLATYPDDASSIIELIEKTDQALYLAKKGGGNRIVYL